MPKLSFYELKSLRMYSKQNGFVIGVDLASRVFQICYADLKTGQIINKSINRSEFERMITDSKFGKCVFGIEACGQCNFWGRFINENGHICRIIPPANISSFGNLRDKSDSIDAIKIFKATFSPSVPESILRDESIQSLAALFAHRAMLMKTRIQLENAFRSSSYEMGILSSRGLESIMQASKELLAQLDSQHKRRSYKAYKILSNDCYVIIQCIKDKIKKIDDFLKKFANNNRMCKHFMTIDGVGPIVAAALYSAMNGNPKMFMNGRKFAGFLGLVPKVTGTGGKILITCVRKGGATHYKQLVYIAAVALVSRLKRTKVKEESAILRKLENAKVKRKVILSIANRISRVAWKLANDDIDFDREKCKFLS